MENNLILPALILVPFIAGFICWLVDKFDQHLPRWIALIGMLITFGLGIALWQTGTYSYELGGKVPTWAAEFHLPWIQTLGISIHLAVDGLSLLMVLLTALLGVLAVGCSWGEIQKNVGFFHLNLLWSLGGVIGVFLAIDLFLLLLLGDDVGASLLPDCTMGTFRFEWSFTCLRCNQVLPVYANCWLDHVDRYLRLGGLWIHDDRYDWFRLQLFIGCCEPLAA